MGSVNRKIAKRANRFHNYLKMLEKHIQAEQEKESQLPLTKPFDLAKTVENEIAQVVEDKRKLRNKRKAKHRVLNNK